MATSSKFDLSSASPDRPLYAGGHRGSHLAASLDRSGSFRESLENPILSSLPSMSRSSSSASQGDVANFFQCLRFDPKVVAADHKSSRQADFKRHMNVAFGNSADESPSGLPKGKLLPSPSPEEIKRAKASLRESSVKARERVKIFNEALCVFNKFFPSIPSKKRSRPEGYSNDRSNASMSTDRSVLGPNLGKMGIQGHAVTSGFEQEQQKLEERTKNAVPNKRTRTSLVDNRMEVRSNALVRPSGGVDRDREMLRLANNGAVHGEDRTLPIVVDGWEKSKMKKKRSGIKPDVSPSVLSAKHTDGYREPKQGMQQRPVTDARSRLTNDSHGFRPGVPSGAAGVGKSDGISQQTGLGMRSSISRADMDNSSILNDRRDRPVGSDKERGNLRVVNKTNVRDEFNSASPTSSTKINASVRAPRSGPSVGPKLSPTVHRATAPNDWELSHCTNKPPAAVGTNRKRTASARSSSPPVAHWASQRPQKISRTARRTNFVPIVSSEEAPALDTVSDAAGSEGSAYAKRVAGNSPQQVKVKCDPLSSMALSESEESGAADTKAKDKGKRSDEVDEKAGQSVSKASALVLPSRKNKLVTGEDLGDGVRRQGRTGRVFTSTRSLVPITVEKLGNVGTAKQLRSTRLGFDKTESKAGRPPTRKLSDRKAYTRQKHAVHSAAADFLVGSDDGHEELLAAVNAVMSSAHASSGKFWRQMELFFGFISDEDLAYLRQQGNLESVSPSPARVPFNVDICSAVSNGYGTVEHERDVAETKSVEFLSDQLVSGEKDHTAIPLYQKLMAALISEEDCDSENEDLKFNAYGAEFELEGELESTNSDHFSNFQPAGHTAFNGYSVSGKPNHDEPNVDILGTSNTGLSADFGHSVNGVLPDKELIPHAACSEFEYDNMQINQRLILELQSVGIFPKPVSDVEQLEEDEISEEIKKLEENCQEEAAKKKGLLNGLLKSASETKELQEKEFEQRALDKLIGMAYEKYMSCRGSNATGGKSSSNKMAKQVALAFVKRTLERCHKFEDTGKSCFADPLFKDMFLSGSVHRNGARSVDTPTDGESGKPYTNTSSCSLEARASASLGSQPSHLTSRFGQKGDGYVVNSFDQFLPMNRLPDTSKEDTWSNRVKKRELLLDDVVGGAIGVSPSAPSGIGSSLSSSTKGKRSERDREGKGHGREVLSRNGTNKIGRPALSNAKGERKPKTKPKQKMAQLSVSVNGLLGKMSEQPEPTLSSAKNSSEMTKSTNAKEKHDFSLNVLDDPEAIDLSSLQLPGMDVLGGADLDVQAQDLGSWLNIDDDGLQDHDDFMGLEIPMDDLADLNMMV